MCQTENWKFSMKINIITSINWGGGGGIPSQIVFENKQSSFEVLTSCERSSCRNI